MQLLCVPPSLKLLHFTLLKIHRTEYKLKGKKISMLCNRLVRIDTKNVLIRADEHWIILGFRLRITVPVIFVASAKWSFPKL